MRMPWGRGEPGMEGRLMMRFPRRAESRQRPFRRWPVPQRWLKFSAVLDSLWATAESAYATRAALGR
jgi:hypothetical protein